MKGIEEKSLKILSGSKIFWASMGGGEGMSKTRRTQHTQHTQDAMRLRRGQRGEGGISGRGRR